MVEVPEGITDWQRQEIERLRAALEAAASSMEWIANHGVDDEDPSTGDDGAAGAGQSPGFTF
jgi:hypothetical protein